MKLENFPKKDFFDVPDAYFDKMSENIFLRIQSEKKIVFKRKLWMVASSVAAVLIVILVVSFFILNVEDQNTDLALNDTIQTKQESNVIDIAKNSTLTSEQNISESDVTPQTNNNIKTSTIRETNSHDAIDDFFYDDMDFCSLDMQIIEYYSEDIVSNDYYELK